MDKKTITIIVLSIIILLLIWFIFTGKSKADAIITTLQEQRIQLVRSNAVVEGELDKSEGYNKELEEDNKELEEDNIELEHIINNIATGSEKTEEHLSEYGIISDDFAEFLQHATVTD